MPLDKTTSEMKELFEVDVLYEVDSVLLKDYLTRSLNGVLRKELILHTVGKD